MYRRTSVAAQRVLKILISNQAFAKILMNSVTVAIPTKI